MKILDVKSLEIEDIKVIRFARFFDNRGYFTETFRESDMPFEFKAVQCNESQSKMGVVRGLHFQWNPYMGKLVRVTYGRMIDIVLDIRIGSPTFGKALLYDMPVSWGDYQEWIWIPPGFAHGNYFIENTVIEYLCTGEYNSKYEAGIRPMDKNIEWINSNVVNFAGGIISDKDKNGLTLKQWTKDKRSKNFIYGKC